MTQPPPEDWRPWLARHGPGLLLYARQLVPAAIAEDAVQEAFVRFWKKRATVREPLAYVVTALRSTCHDLRRHAQRSVHRESDYADHAPPWFTECQAAANLIAAERARQIQTALQTLPEAQRELLVLKLWNDLTFAQIAATLDLSPNTAASRYRYALQALRPLLQPLAETTYLETRP